MENLYEILGVKPEASAAQIKKAYRAKAFKLHPDRKGGNKEAFQKLQRAYEILSDPERRAAYNRGDSVDKRIQTMAERVEATAMQKILECLDSAMRSFDEVDFKKEVLHGCEQAKKSAKAVHKEIRKRLRMIRRMKKRMKKAEFYMFDHLANRRRAVLMDYLQLRFDRKVVRKVQEIMVAMEYEAPEPKQPGPDERALSTLQRLLADTGPLMRNQWWSRG